MRLCKESSRKTVTPLVGRCIVICALLTLPHAGCRRSDRVATPFAGYSHSETGGQSVKPGINESYNNPDVDKWVARFESESREIFKHRRRIVEGLGIEPGIVLGDIGSGTGLFTPLFSETVGAAGKVVAVDIVPEFLQLIRTRARRQNLRNVQTVLCDEDSVALPPASIDLAFVCDTYHHFEYPRSTLSSIHRALKPGGQLIVIDFRRIPGESRKWVLNHVRAGRKTVTAEVIAAGFTLADDQPQASYLEENYVLRFRKAE